MTLTICDVGPRDGLQNESAVIDPAVRASLVDRLADARVPRVEAVSFVNPTRVPQMAGAEEVARAIHHRTGSVYSALVLNEKGYERLSRSNGLDHVNVTIGFTESFNRRNSNMSILESTSAAERIIARAHADGRRASVTLAVAFGCPFEGATDRGRVLALAERLVSSEADEIVFADTIGVAVPTQVRLTVEEALRMTRLVGVHLHNTRNTGFVNAYAAVEAGAEILDASVGGIGGCPFAPGATGNIATEDLLYLLHGEGIDTGIDIDALVSTSRWLEGILGRTLPGQLYRLDTFQHPLVGTGS
jgi:hydroxymethylglutaryl-CoA lyase